MVRPANQKVYATQSGELRFIGITAGATECAHGLLPEISKLSDGANGEANREANRERLIEKPPIKSTIRTTINKLANGTAVFNRCLLGFFLLLKKMAFKRMAINLHIFECPKF